MATIPASEHVTATVAFTDAYGNPVDAPVLAAAVAWASDNANVTVTAIDAFTADVAPVGPATTGVTVSATYDLGAGPVTIVSEPIDVVAGAVSAAALTLSAPVAK